MRTTVDLPDALLRRAKATAALEGKTLKAFLKEAIEQKLAQRSEGKRIKKRASLPLVKSTAPGTLKISADTISAALLAEDLHALTRHQPLAGPHVRGS